MKLTTSKTSAILPSRASIGNMAIVGSISVLSASIGFCSAASAAVLYQADYSSGTINTISSTGVVTPFATGLGGNGPIGLAFGKDGYLYATNYNGGSPSDGVSINKISPDGKTVSIFTTGPSASYGLASDKKGNLFATNSILNTIDRISETTAQVTPFVTTGLNFPAYLAFNNSGKLFESDHSSDTVNTISLVDGSITFFATVEGARGMAFDNDGNLFVVNAHDGQINKISSDGTSNTIFTTGLNHPFGLAFDDSGRLFVSDTGTNTVKQISLLDGTASSFASGFNVPFSLVLGPDPSGASTAVPEPFTIVGTLIGGTAALRMRKKLKDSNKA